MTTSGNASMSVQRSAKVDHADAQGKSLLDDGIGKIDLARALDASQDLLIQLVEVGTHRLCLGTVEEIVWNIAKGRNAQILRQGLDLGIVDQQVVQGSCQIDVVSHHLHIAGAAHLLQSEPDFEGAKAARVLQSVLEVVRGQLAKVIVRRTMREGTSQRLGIPHQGAACLQGSVEPLVWIHRDGIGLRHAREQIGSLGNRGGQSAVGTIDVEPEVSLTAELGELRERVDCPSADGTGRADHQERLITLRNILVELTLQIRQVHARFVVDSNPTQRVGPESRDIHRLVDPGVDLSRGVDAQRTPWVGVEAASLQVPARLRSAGGKEADDIRQVAAADQYPARALGIADELGDPAHRLGLDLRGHRCDGPGSDIGVDRGGEQISQHADGGRRRGDVAEEAGMAVEEGVIEE